MAQFRIVDCDNVRETFTGAGSTTITLGGAAQYSRSFSGASFAAGDTSFITARIGSEESTGIFTCNGSTITQTSVWRSSNGNAAVSFSSGGVGEVFIDSPARLFDELNLAAITVVSAATCDIGGTAAQSAKIIISGTVTITSLGTAAHKRRMVHFSGALTLTHNATSLILPGAANITTAAGDTAIFMSDSTGNWRCYAYQPATTAGMRSLIGIARKALSTTTNYYVRTDGNDSLNDGGADTSGGAFLTPQGAANYLSNKVDLNGSNAVVLLRGAFTSGVFQSTPFVGKGQVTFAAVDGVASSITVAGGNCFFASGGAAFSVYGNGAGAGTGTLTLSTTGSGNCMQTGAGGTITQHGNIFGASAGTHMESGASSLIYCDGSYSVSGGAAIHWHASASGGEILMLTGTITLTGTPAFSSFFAGLSYGEIFLSASVVISGSATGVRFLSHYLGYLNAGALTSTTFPGSSAGTVNDGGIFIGNSGTELIIGLTMASMLNMAAPATPASGYTNFYVDSTSKIPSAKNDAGVISSMVVLGTGVATFLATPSSANLISAVTDETGSGALVFGTSPVITGLGVGGVITGSQTGMQITTASQPMFAVRSTSGAAGKQMARFIYDPASALTNPGFLFQTLSDAGAFASNDNVFWNGGGISIGNLTYTPGLVVGAPTGGNKGAGTINATAVYDDNVLLTCMALEFLNEGKVDIDYWDSTVPDRVIPAEIIPARAEEIPVTEDVEVIEMVLDPVDGGYVAREEKKIVSKQVTVFAPVHDADGNGIDAIEEPVFETKEIPEQIVREEAIEPRRHELAHRFKLMVDEGFNPRSPAAYIAKLKKDQALPGMPTKEDWEHGAHSVGEIHNRLWLATELLAMTVVALEGRITALEARR